MNNIFTSMPPVAWHTLLSFLALWVGQYLGSYEWGTGLAVLLNLAVRGIALYMEKEKPTPAAAAPRSGYSSAPIVPKRSKITRLFFG